MSLPQVTGATADLRPLVTSVIDSIVGKEEYQHAKVAVWGDQITKTLLERLKMDDADARHIVTCTLIQRRGLTAGVHSVAACHWNAASDKANSFQWESPSMFAQVFVFRVQP